MKDLNEFEKRVGKALISIDKTLKRIADALEKRNQIRR